MSNDRKDIAIAIYDLHSQAEAAVKTLQNAGFNMKNLSIVGRDYHTKEHVVGFLNAGDRAKVLGKLGAFWGCLLYTSCDAGRGSAAFNEPGHR